MVTRILSLTLFAVVLGASNLFFSGDASSASPTTSMLEEAIRAGNAAAASAALDAGEDPDSRTASGAPMLVLAASMNSPNIVGALLKNGASVNATTPGGASALMYVSGSNNGALAKQLLDAGADIDLRDEQGDPAINWGSYYGALEYVQTLLEFGPDTSLRGHGNAFEIALRRGHEETLAALAAFNGTVSDNPEAGLDPFGRPILHQAARSGDMNTLTSYLENDATPDIEDQIGFTALMHAARDGAMAPVEMLVANGANVNHRGSDYGLALTPLHLAAIGNHSEIVTFLIDNGALLDVQGVTGQTPLAWALNEGSRESAETLLRAGADWQVGSDLSKLAESRGWPEIVELMSR